MARQTGSNVQDIRQKNTMLVLRLIAAGAAETRAGLAEATGLSRMAVGNIVSGLAARGIIENSPEEPDGGPAFGRPPATLRIAASSPKICGMLIKRGLLQVVLSDLSGRILRSCETRYDLAEISAERLVDMLRELYRKIAAESGEKIFAVGVSSLGPVNSLTGELLNPPDFCGIANLDIAAVVREFTGLPVFLINDANAGALAEKLYGCCRHTQNFIYLHMMNGIGAGLVLEDRLYGGDSGQSGEIGHTSVNFIGPKCSCGNAGCLDLYANLAAMRRKRRVLAPLYPQSPLAEAREPEWEDFVDEANRRDPLAMAVLDEFCGYVSAALVNALNLLDLSTVVVGYNCRTEGYAVEEMLSARISSSAISSKYRGIRFLHSVFGGDAPLVGSIAVVADQVFSLRLKLPDDRK